MFANKTKRNGKKERKKERKKFRSKNEREQKKKVKNVSMGGSRCFQTKQNETEIIFLGTKTGSKKFQKLGLKKTDKNPKF